MQSYYEFLHSDSSLRIRSMFLNDDSDRDLPCQQYSLPAFVATLCFLKEKWCYSQSITKILPVVVSLEVVIASPPPKAAVNTKRWGKYRGRRQYRDKCHLSWSTLYLNNIHCWQRSSLNDVTRNIIHYPLICLEMLHFSSQNRPPSSDTKSLLSKILTIQKWSKNSRTRRNNTILIFKFV